MSINCACGVSYIKTNKLRHERSKNHMQYIEGFKPIEKTDDIVDDNIEDNISDISDKAVDENFLNELDNENFNFLQPETEVKNVQPKMTKRMINKINKNLDDISIASNEIFSNKNPTEILGKDRRILLAKIQQYRILFPTELGKFKLKKKPTIDDLNDVISEMDAILDTSTVDGFVMDGIMQSFKVIEGASSHTRYNLSGLSDMLKNNKQFNSLVKQLYLKYQVFSKVPVEMQLGFIIMTTAYITIQKNKQRPQMEQYLNESSNINI